MNFFDNLMSPLGKNNCLLFYYLGIISLLFAVVAFINLVVNLFKSKKMDSGTSALVMAVLSNLVMYYFARIHYSICLAALQ